MARVDFSATLWQRNKRFVVKTEMVLDTEQEARDFIEWLAGMVRDHVHNHGGTVIDTKPQMVQPKG